MGDAFGGQPVFLGGSAKLIRAFFTLARNDFNQGYGLL